MIRQLRAENIAIIEEAHLELGAGLTVFTGETGAGKSLLIDAIALALGERADSDLVRAGAGRATVTMSMDLSGWPMAQLACKELGIELEEGQLFIDREVAAEGRSSCRLNSKPSPVGTLKQIGEGLVDLHGQHEHQSLLSPERHLSFLDAWAGEDIWRQKQSVSGMFEQAARRKEQLKALQTGHREREQKLDLLRFQIAEIESISPAVGEHEELQAELRRLQNVEALSMGCLNSLEGLSSGEQAASDQLSAAIRQLEDSAALDPSLEPTLEHLRQAYYALEEGVVALSHYADQLEADPARTDQVAERLEALKRLRRKYGDDEGAVLTFCQQAQQELENLTQTEFDETELEQELAGLENDLAEACQRLSSLRHKKAKLFGGLVQEQLRELAMEKADFGVRLSPKPVDATGADNAEFFFSANPGEPSRPLAKVASGGELSRLMLAIKVILAGKAGVPTLIFDEVDSGLSGRAAAVVASKLALLAKNYQILAITHLPQIASRAQVHFRIEKQTDKGRTKTTLRALSQEERVEEIARMLAGEQVGASALANARELLLSAASQ